MLVEIMNVLLDPVPDTKGVSFHPNLASTFKMTGAFFEQRSIKRPQ